MTVFGIDSPLELMRSQEKLCRIPGRLAVVKRERYAFIGLVLLTLTGAPCPKSVASGQLFAPPAPVEPRDEILLISTRPIGTACNSNRLRQGLTCQRFVKNTAGQVDWTPSDWRLLLLPDRRPTIFYVHGNRVSPGRDLAEGRMVYQSLKRHSPLRGPVRFVIFSWPSEQIPGPIKDYLVKAQRTNPVAWQLAWLLDKMPLDTPIALVGYSYGTRVVSGASHLLGGGSLGPLHLTERAYPSRPPLRAGLLAAAFDADWIQPGRFYTNTLEKTERLVLGTNKLDPAMRFYHLSNGRGRMHALGRAGVDEPASIAAYAGRVRQIDFTGSVGRSHVLSDYLSAEHKMSRLWRELLTPGQRPIATADRIHIDLATCSNNLTMSQ